MIARSRTMLRDLLAVAVFVGLVAVVMLWPAGPPTRSPVITPPIHASSPPEIVPSVEASPPSPVIAPSAQPPTPRPAPPPQVCRGPGRSSDHPPNVGKHEGRPCR